MRKPGAGGLLDDEVVSLWKELYPSSAYLEGWNDFAGKLFIPSSVNIERMLRRVRELKQKASDETQSKVLEAIEADLMFEEPQPVMDNILNSIYSHLVKEGVNPQHLKALLVNSIEAVKASTSLFMEKNVTVPVRMLTLYRLNGILGIVDTVSNNTKDKGLKELCSRLSKSLKEFVSLFEVKGFGEGTFEEAEAVFSKYGSDLGRKKFYPIALKKAYDYTETPAQLEKKALAWLDEEVSSLSPIIAELSRHYKCKPTLESVENAIDERYSLKPKDLVKLTAEVREVVKPFVDERVAHIHPDYTTKVVETPSYLTGVVPTAAAQFFDTFSEKPFQLYFITTDPKRDPMRSVPDLIDTLVHEEYGHCVHHFNSSKKVAGEVRRVELIFTSHAGAVTEGLAFNREREFIEASRSIEVKRKLSAAESNYAMLLERFGGVHLLNLELEFIVRKWRLIRFLRVIGDVRINTGSQSLPDFLTWANKKTGISRSSMYFQLFPAHEGTFPGYATTYAVLGEEIRQLEQKIKQPERRIEFSTYLTSIGYPPRSLYRKKLEKFVRTGVRS